MRNHYDILYGFDPAFIHTALVPVLCPILTPARLLPPIGRFRVRCGGGVRIRGVVRIRQSDSDFNKRGNNLSGGRKWAQHRD